MQHRQQKGRTYLGWYDIKDTLQPGETIQRTITDKTLPTERDRELHVAQV